MVKGGVRWPDKDCVLFLFFFAGYIFCLRPITIIAAASLTLREGTP